MPRGKDQKEKPDKRTIPTFFRAVEKRFDHTYYGRLVSDDGFKFVSFSSHDGNESHFRERVQEKADFNFSKITAHEFEYYAKRAIYIMQDEVKDKQFELDALSHNYSFAQDKLNELLRG